MSSETTLKAVGISAGGKIDAIVSSDAETPVVTTKADKPKLTKAEKAEIARKSDEQIINMSRSGGVTSKEVAAIRGTARHGPYVRQLKRLVKDGKLRMTSLERDGVPVYTFNEGGTPVTTPKKPKPVTIKKPDPVLPSELEVEIMAPVITPEEASQAGEELGRSLTNAIRVLQSFADGLKSTLG